MNHLQGRPTTDPKDQTLKLRLNDEMRRHIEVSSERCNVSMSEYIRILIRNDMNREKI